MPSLLAACVVHALREDPSYFGVTAIDKRAVEGVVTVTRYGLRRDVQADRKHHGGIDKALYAYSQDDADYWASELGRELPPGWFGENLRLDGLDVNSARVGEIWQIGDSVRVQVTGPRTPCRTFAHWVGGAEESGWVKRFSDERRLGVYLRVIRTGAIQAGDPLTIVSVPEGAPTVLEIYRAP